ncbi:uncharacterized protein LOC144077528 isoform X1 [Stigmatopora argus]
MNEFPSGRCPDQDVAISPPTSARIPALPNAGHQIGSRMVKRHGGRVVSAPGLTVRGSRIQSQALAGVPDMLFTARRTWEISLSRVNVTQADVCWGTRTNEDGGDGRNGQMFSCGDLSKDYWGCWSLS